MKEENCPECKGTGLVPHSSKDDMWCHTCNGTGEKIRQETPDEVNKELGEQREGEACQHLNTFPYHHGGIDKCKDCGAFIKEGETPALTERIEQAANDYNRRAYCGHFGGEEPSYHFISGAEWQKQQTSGEWIPIEKGLPEDSEKFVLATNGYDIFQARYTILKYWRTKDDGVKEISHWMKLPLPPAPKNK